MLVAPHVFITKDTPDFIPNREVADVVWAPSVHLGRKLAARHPNPAYGRPPNSFQRLSTQRRALCLGVDLPNVENVFYRHRPSLAATAGNRLNLRAETSAHGNWRWRDPQQHS